MKRLVKKKVYPLLNIKDDAKTILGLMLVSGGVYTFLAILLFLIPCSVLVFIFTLSWPWYMSVVSLIDIALSYICVTCGFLCDKVYSQMFNRKNEQGLHGTIRSHAWAGVLVVIGAIAIFFFNMFVSCSLFYT